MSKKKKAKAKKRVRTPSVVPKDATREQIVRAEFGPGFDFGKQQLEKLLEDKSDLSTYSLLNRANLPEPDLSLWPAVRTIWFSCPAHLEPYERVFLLLKGRMEMATSGVRFPPLPFACIKMLRALADYHELLLDYEEAHGEIARGMRHFNHALFDRSDYCSALRTISELNFTHLGILPTEATYDFAMHAAARRQAYRDAQMDALSMWEQFLRIAPRTVDRTKFPFEHFEQERHLCFAQRFGLGIVDEGDRRFLATEFDQLSVHQKMEFIERRHNPLPPLRGAYGMLPVYLTLEAPLMAEMKWNWSEIYDALRPLFTPKSPEGWRAFPPDAKALSMGWREWEATFLSNDLRPRINPPGGRPRAKREHCRGKHLLTPPGEF